MDNRKIVVLVLLLFFCGCTAQDNVSRIAKTESSQVPPIIDKQLRRDLTVYLDDICQWIMARDLVSGVLKGISEEGFQGQKEFKMFIFINSNMARVLLTTSQITGNQAYKTEAMQWFDVLYNQQQTTISSNIDAAAFWPVCPYMIGSPYNNIYFGDTGTATTALAIGYRHANADRKKLYIRAMKEYANFIMHGSIKDPQSMGRGAVKSWIIHEGPDKGALGCGYYGGRVSKEPYIIATATTGGAFFSELYDLTGDKRYKQVAEDAVRWILKQRKDDGEIPYILAGKDPAKWDWPLDTITYCTEAFIAADTYLDDAQLSSFIKKEVKPTVQWLLDKQNPDGSWGKMRSQDQQRSPCCLNLLNWYYYNVEPDPKIAESIRRYCRFLLDPEKSKLYGNKEFVITTGFVGLAVAEILEPGSTF